MTVPRRPRFAICLALLLSLAASFSSPAFGQANPPTQPRELDAFTRAGASVTMLASANFAKSANEDEEALVLSRVAPDVSDPNPIIVSGGPELWYAESGSVALTGEDGATQTIAPGGQAVLSQPGQYTARFSGADCPSALRLELSAVIAMKITSEEHAPLMGPNGAACPVSATLFDADGAVAKRPESALGFIARISWPGQTYLSPAAFSGPIGYAVEHGTIQLSGPKGVNLGLSPGGWATLAASQSHWTYTPGAAPSDAIVAGAFAVGGAPATPIATPAATPAAVSAADRYVGPNNGYSVTWDPSWSEIASTGSASSYDLALTNGVSRVFFQTYGNFVGDASACLNDIVAGLPSDAGYSQVAEHLGSDGKPLAGGDAVHRYATYDFTYTSTAGATRYTERIECRALVAGSSMLVITQIVHATNFPAQADAVQPLLDAIKIPASP